MASSRYRNVNVVNESGQSRYYETVDFPSAEVLAAIPSFKIRAARFDRLDQLAYKHLGQGELWWIIALMNDIDWMYNFEEGQILRIPLDASDVLRLI